MTPQEYSQLKADRQAIIRANAGRRLRGLPALPVPTLPPPPMIYLAFTVDGDYIGSVPEATTEAEAAEITAQFTRQPFRIVKEIRR